MSDAQATNDQTTNNAINQIVVVNDAFSAEECDAILALGDTLSSEDGDTFQASGAFDKPRQSRVSWIHPGEETKWLFEKFSNIVTHINANNYRFDIESFEPMQLAEYPPGGYYEWHMDLGPGRFSRRKLSFTVQLSRPEDYEGGNLEFQFQTFEIPRQRGTVIAFPPYLHHRVAPVTTGLRKALVAWVLGPPFR